jgi:hypothetical protein
MSTFADTASAGSLSRHWYLAARTPAPWSWVPGRTGFSELPLGSEPKRNAQSSLPRGHRSRSQEIRGDRDDMDTTSAVHAV